MSSHREAPEISRDPVADSTDVYAFVSPDRPDSVTLIANYIPLQGPDGGPNFYAFGDRVLYAIHIDNDADGVAEITYEFRFQDELQIPGTFLYNVGPIESLDSKNWNRRQFYSVTRIDHISHRSTQLGEHLASPPCNIGPLSTPDFGQLAAEAVHQLPRGHVVYAGQRAEGFYVDLGSIFDLGDLRPFADLHASFGLPPVPKADGVNATRELNVHTIALQVPITQLTVDGSSPSDPADQRAVIGVWTTASRQQVHVRGRESDREDVEAGPFLQVSRLGNPLINEVLIPLGQKDYWNRQAPADDRQFVAQYQHPELAALLPVLYPGVFPNLASLNSSNVPRADLVAVLLTGIPAGLIPGFQNSTGPTLADTLRLNMAISPASTPSNLGLLGGDLAGFPNGRRVFDDVVTIELRAIAGVTYPLIDPTFKPDGAASVVTDGLTSNPADLTAKGTESYLDVFPYLGVPYSGFAVPAS
jgi:hypothetical protein